MSKTLRYIVGSVVATGATVGGVALYRRLRSLPPEGGDAPAAPLPSNDPQTPAPAPGPASPTPTPNPGPVPPPHPTDVVPVSWDGLLPLPTAAEVKGDLTRNWGKTPTDLRPLLLLIEEATGIFGAARILSAVSYGESRWIPNSHNGNDQEEQSARNASWRAYHRNKDRNPPLMFGEQAANFGAAGLFNSLAPYGLWTGVQELKDKAPLLNSDPRILFVPRVAAFVAAVYLQRLLAGYDVRDILDIKAGWGSISLLTDTGRQDADYTRIRNQFADDIKKVGIDLADAATIPKMLTKSPKWPGVQAVFDKIVVKLPTPGKAVT